MCNFFSLVSDGKGKIMYFDWKIRQEILAGKLNYTADSHTSIADYYGYKGKNEDMLNKYEYNFLTQKFTIDQLNTTDDSLKVKKLCKKLNTKKIIPPLIVKPIINPFKDRACTKITKADIRLLVKWASVWASVWDSVRASVGASVGDSVMDSVRASVGASVRDSVGDSVWASVWDSVRVSVRDSIGASIGDSIGASIWAYYSSFFNIKYEYDFSSVVKLWEKGIVPSFDGKTWRLHGKDGKVLKEITKEELAKLKGEK